jgi:two-component system OmpR family response regulator
MTEHMTAGRIDRSNRLDASRLKVLVVDDEPDLADIAGALLTYHGIEALVVYSAQDALQLLELHTDIDAVFSDVIMPVMNGLELAETVSNLYPAIKIVLTSGFTALNFWDKQTRPYLLIPKPYSIDKVIHLLRG